MKRRLWAFLVLFIAYQLPEGLGQHVLRSEAAHAGLWLLFYAVVVVLGRALDGPRTYALQRAPGGLRLLGMGIVLATSSKALALWAGSAAGIYAVRPTPEVPWTVSGLVLAVAFTLVPSLAEDIVTRGYVYEPVSRRWGPVVFVLFSAVLFVVNHLYRLALGPREWGMLLAFGLPYAAALARTETLWAAVGVHWGWNLANALVPFGWTVTRIASAETGALVSSLAHGVMLVVILVLWPRTAASDPRPV